MAGEDQHKDYLGKDSIRPDFLHAKDTLGQAESAAAHTKATTAKEPGTTTKEQANSSEQNSTKSFYKGTGRKNIKPKGLRGRLRGKGALGVLMIVLTLGALGIFGSSSFLGAHLDALVTEITDTQHITMTLRKRALLKQMLGGEVEPTNTLKSNFAKQDIELADAGSARTLTYKNQTITADNFDDVISSNPEFRDSVSQATYGRAANYFDSSSEQYFSDVYQTRDLQRNFSQTGDRDTDDANYDQLMSEYHAGDADANINTAEDRPLFDEETGEPILDENGEQVIERQLTGEDVRGTSIKGATAVEKAHSYLLGTSRKVAAAGGLVCAVLKVGNLVSVAVAAKDVYNAIHYFMTQSESQSKVKAGEGSNSGIHAWLEFLNTPATTTVVDPTTNEEVELTGTPLEDDGIRSYVGDLAPRVENTKYFSIERPFVSVMTAIATNYGSAAICGGAQLAGAVVSVATIASGGFIRMSIGLLLDTILSTAFQVAIVAALGAMIPIIAQTLFSNPYDTAAGIPGGALYARGAMLSNSVMLGRNTSAQGPADEATVLAFNRATDVVLSQDAEVERLYHSPLDASSPKTFLGNVMSKLLPLASTTSTTSIVSTISSVTSSSLASLSPTHAAGIGDSFLTTFGQDCTVAAGIGATADPYCGTRMVSDTALLDLSLNDPEYRAVIERSIEYDENGNEVIKDGSGLAEFIKFFLMRMSPLGMTDASISAECQTNFSVFGRLPYIGDILQAINAVEEAACLDVATGKKFVASVDNEYWQTEGKYYQLYVSTTRVLDQFGAYEEAGAINPVVAFKQEYRESHPIDTSPAGLLATISGLSYDDAELVLAIAEYGDFLANYNPEERYAFGDDGDAQATLVKRGLFGSVRSYDEEEATSPVTTGARSDPEKTVALLAHAIIYPDLRNRSYAV